jgi:hypothetical protein
MVFSWCACGQAPPVRSMGGAGQASSGGSLPEVFSSVLPEVKAKTGLPVLLPGELPKPFRDAKYAVVQKATANEYAILLYYKLDIGDAGFSASFMGEGNPKYNPRELPNIHDVKLARGIDGFFRPVSCGGSCAPANLWWEREGVLYDIQLRLPSDLRQDNQEKTITAVANSAILAGPR